MEEIEKMFSVFENEGAARYGSERINQLEHALQCAWLAERESGDPALITAALFHDIGHMMHKLGDDAAIRGVDDRHEDIGYKYLRQYFGEDVCMSVKMHVDAKRYLCTVEEGYFDSLSAGSVRSLQLQGGPFSHDEAEAFINSPLARDAVALRRWDEGAKVEDLTTPELAYFRQYVQNCYRPSEQAA
tara:strand:- start:1163 stop:1723 length:561 start_codon:yes stop_codon:yes gene_type:complete